jgi:hypothetical protein
MTQRSAPGIEQPRVEPEIIPPGDVRSRRAGASFDGTQRVYVARVGPFGFAMVALAIAALAMLLFLLVLGAFVILIPLAGGRRDQNACTPDCLRRSAILLRA